MTTLELTLLAYAIMSVIGIASLVYYWGLPVLKDSYPKLTRWFSNQLKKYTLIYLMCYLVLHITLVAMAIHFIIQM